MPATATSIPLMTCQVAGTAHHCTAAIRATLREGQAVDLRREGGNDFDPNAVAVFSAGGDRIGYLPRRYNVVLARLLDAGKCLKAVLHEWSQPDPDLPWLEMIISIALEE